MTSFAFILDYVPDPVYHTTREKCSSSFPSFTSFAASIIAFPILASSPNSRFV